MATLAKRNNGRSGLGMVSPFDRFFRNDFMDLWDNPNMLTVPSINISEGRNSYKVELAAPGLKKEDINVDVDGNMMTISAEKTAEEKSGGEDEQTYSRREYNYSSFSRSFTIPENADGENIKARYCDGVLCIEIPKKKENQKSGSQKIRVE